MKILNRIYTVLIIASYPFYAATIDSQRQDDTTISQDEANKILFQAIQSNDREQAVFALQNGADITAEVDREGKKPTEESPRKKTQALIRAARQGDRYALQQLKLLAINVLPVGIAAPLDKIATYVCSGPTASLLNYAICGGDTGMVALLTGYKPTAVNLETQGRTPLQLAVITNNLQAVLLFLMSGAHVGAESSVLGDQAIHLAAAAQEPLILKKLIEFGGDVNAKTTFERRPLHIAAEIGSPEVIEELIMQGAYIDVLDFEKLEPVERAAIARNYYALPVFYRFGRRIIVS